MSPLLSCGDTGQVWSWATAWRFPPALNFWVEAKIRAGSLVSGAHTCLFVFWRPWLWHKRDKASYNCGRGGEKRVWFWGWWWEDFRRSYAGETLYSWFKDVYETVLTRGPAALTHSHAVLTRSTDGKSRLCDACWRLSHGQGTEANGFRKSTHGCEAVVN